MDSTEGKTRNWFQRAVKLLSKSKQEINEPTNDFILPTELVENILRRVTRHTLFECRLVNRQWNSVASKELERRSLLNWTSWGTYQGASWNIIETQFKPAVYIFETPRSLMYSSLTLPPAISTSKTLTTNPFPTNSLTILPIYRHLTWILPSLSCMLQMSMRLDKFFCQYGHFLTHLNFSYSEVTLWQLKQVLIYTPNLQALTFFPFGHIQEARPATMLPLEDADGIVVSPNLATLVIYRDCQVYLADWLLRSCAHQLVKLIVTTEGEELLRCILKRKFEKLKQLRILCFKAFRAFNETWKGKPHPKLEDLFIGAMFQYCEIDISDKMYMDFIGKFSSTLVSLVIEMAPVSRGGFGYLKQKGIIFSKVRSLTLRKHEHIVSWEGTQEKRDAEVLFPNVSDVKLVDFKNLYLPAG
ncbi:unnamed protein product [Orchesella dallaii]|uniref:F-box domain-containing protein n=1 Tax=Orchesella dallaii TaxID=48710 RepID=A0ABP1RW42_9HEXA